MFTGIIEEIGNIVSIKVNGDSRKLFIKADKILEDVHRGDSIAVNGICLTVTEFSDSEFSVDVMHETMKRTSLNKLKTNSKVNLERAMAANGRFGGHIVSGHIDGSGIVKNINKDSNAIWYTIEADLKIMKYVVEKGSITIDGISLTVANVRTNSFDVSIIPHTLENTILAFKKINDIVNIENDCIGKYVEKLMNKNKKESNINREFLLRNGF